MGIYAELLEGAIGGLLFGDMISDAEDCGFNGGFDFDFILLLLVVIIISMYISHLRAAKLLPFGVICTMYLYDVKKL